MPNVRRRVGLGAVLCLAVAGCYGSTGEEGDGDAERVDSEVASDDGAPEVLSISLDPTDIEMCDGNDCGWGPYPVTATAVFSDGTTRDVTVEATWASSDNAVAVIDDPGMVTAVGEGNALVMATWRSVASEPAYVAVWGCHCIRDIQVTPAEETACIGDTVPFLALGIFADGATEEMTDEVDWRSSNEAVATIGNGGEATAIGLGTTRIRAILAGARGDIISNEAILTVGSEPDWITVRPADVMLADGETEQFRAMMAWTCGETTDETEAVDWYSSDPEVVTVSNEPGSKGEATAMWSSGEATISVTSEYGLAERTTPGRVVVTGCTCLLTITVDPFSATVHAGCGDVLALEATGHYDDGTSDDMTADVTWTSGDEDVAVVSNASGHEGEVTGVAAGVAPITAGVEGVVSSPAVITVVPGDCVVSIAVSPPRAEICTGGEQAFTATALWADLHAEDATSYALWTSADAAVATIDSSGVATGVGPGETTITAGVGPVSGTAALAVVNSDPLSISIDPVAPTARVGDSLQFHGRMSWTCGETTDETEASVWASSDPGVATVSNDAGTRGLAAVLAPGTTTITVTATIGLGDRDDSTVLTVTE